MNFGALAKVYNSQSAIIVVLILTAAAVLCALGKLPYQEWKDLALWVGITYVGGEKLRDGAAAFRSGPKPPAG